MQPKRKKQLIFVRFGTFVWIKFFQSMVLRFFQKKRKRNFVFVHINKTGGMSIEKALRFTEKQHNTALEFKRKLGIKKWEKVFKFSIVRNPWD